MANQQSKEPRQRVCQESTPPHPDRAILITMIYSILTGCLLDWLQSLKQFFINVSFYLFVDFLINKLYLVSNSDGSVLRPHQSKTSYKYIYDTSMKIVLRTGASLGAY